MNEKVLFGYGSGVSKKGNEFLSLNIGFPYGETAQQNGFVGYNVQTKFANTNCLNSLNKDMIGKKIDIVYGCNEKGFPEIIDIKVVK